MAHGARLGTRLREAAMHRVGDRQPLVAVAVERHERTRLGRHDEWLERSTMGADDTGSGPTA